MLPTLKSLLWKESREHRWEFVTLVTIFSVPAVAGFFGYLLKDAIPGMKCANILAYFIVLLLATFLPAFVAVATITREHEYHTFHTLSALPAHPWIVFANKTFFGLFLVAVPTAIACAVLFPTFEDNFPTFLPGTIWMSSLIYLWTIFLLTSCRSETLVAVFGVLLAIACYLLAAVLLAVCNAFAPDYCGYVLEWILPFHPFSSLLLTTTARPSNLPYFLLVQFFLAISLFLGACWRYTRLTKRLSSGFPSSPTAPLPRTMLLEPSHSARILPAPLPFQTRPFFAPLFWKSWRETRVVFAFALLATLLLAIPILFLNQSTDPAGSHLHSIIFLDAWRFLGTTGSVVVAIILGIQPWSVDLRPNISTFWRSLPFPISATFFTRYLTGLIAAILLAAIPALATLAVTNYSMNHYPSQSSRPIVRLSDGRDIIRAWSEIHATSANALYTDLPAIPLIYSIAAFSTTLFRRTLHAAILSIGAAVFLWTIPFIIWGFPSDPEILWQLSTPRAQQLTSYYLVPLLPLAALTAYLTYRAFRSNFSLSNSP
jgi:hypothetical protein